MLMVNSKTLTSRQLCIAKNNFAIKTGEVNVDVVKKGGRLFGRLFVVQFILFFFFTLSSSCLFSATLQFYSKNSFFADTEPMSFIHFTTDWSGDLIHGEKALAYYWAESGIRSDKIGIGYLSRQHYYLSFSNDAAQFYQLVQNSLPLEAGRSYQIDLNLKHFALNGFRMFVNLFQNISVKWEVGFSRLYGSRLYDGYLKGTVTSSSEKDYDYHDMNVDYFYTKDAIFDRELSAPAGTGYAFDTALLWRPDERLQVHFKMYDIAGKIHWRNTPRTVALLESDNKTYDENGYVRVHPALSGRHSFEAFTQSLPWFASVDTQMKFRADAALLFSILAMDSKHYHSAGLAWWTREHVRLQMNYTVSTGTVSLAAKGQYLDFGIGFDHFDFYKARRLQLKLDFILPIY
ncbi:MAG: hypothetical protein OEX07_12565 [Gammaproteobacteria bacterium]|nr:hypothetical protein [Gammaproteobacteria bacterium]